MKVNLRFLVSAFVLFVVIAGLILFAPRLEQISAQTGRQIPAAERENAYRTNNLEVAQLEQYNHQVSADEFRRALELDPQLKIARINLVIAPAQLIIRLTSSPTKLRVLKNYPPYSWSGGSQIVDFEGRLLADASPGPGERIVVAPIDVSALR